MVTFAPTPALDLTASTSDKTASMVTMTVLSQVHKMEGQYQQCSVPVAVTFLRRYDQYYLQRREADAHLCDQYRKGR